MSLSNLARHQRHFFSSPFFFAPGTQKWNITPSKYPAVVFWLEIACAKAKNLITRSFSGWKIWSLGHTKGRNRRRVGRTTRARILPDGPRSSPDNDNGRYGHNHQAGVVELGFAAKKKPGKGRIIIIGSSSFLWEREREDMMAQLWWWGSRMVLDASFRELDFSWCFWARIQAADCVDFGERKLIRLWQESLFEGFNGRVWPRSELSKERNFSA